MEGDIDRIIEPLMAHDLEERLAALQAVSEPSARIIPRLHVHPLP